jgi:hypothetical protein
MSTPSGTPPDKPDAFTLPPDWLHLPDGSVVHPPLAADELELIRSADIQRDPQTGEPTAVSFLSRARLYFLAIRL